MNTQQDYKDDPLRLHLKPEMIEKAPPHFTEKIMQMVSLEPRPVQHVSRFRRIGFIPAISVAFTLALMIAALLSPSSSYNLSWMPGINTLTLISQQAHQINLDALSRITLPAYMPYLFLSILFLTFFDRALRSLFSRHKQ